MSEHTKGKWEAKTWDTGTHYVAVKDSTTVVCVVYGSEADAKLIASTPETAAQRDALLAACKENYEFTKYAAANKKLNTDEYIEMFFSLCESAQNVAKAAIAAGE